MFAAESRVIQFHSNPTPIKNPFLSKTGSPIIMLVCHDSRQVGLRLYKKLEWPGTPHDSVFVSWELDIILIKSKDFKLFLARIRLDQTKGSNDAVSTDDLAALQAAKNTIHQQINRNCRRLGTYFENFELLEDAIRRLPGLHFSQMQHLLVVKGNTNQGKQDKITLEPVANGP
jgi:hypothetical protein